MLNKIVILTPDPFPIGMAGANRIISYGKGLSENNVSVKVICLKSHERLKNGITNNKIVGEHEGIKYVNACGTILRGKSFIKRRMLVFKGAINAFHIIFKERKQIDAMLLYATDLGYILYFFLVSKILSILYINERSEFPIVLILNKRSFFKKIYAKFYVSFAYKLFDAIFVMTGQLKSYYQRRIRKDAKLLQVPMTVEPKRFEGTFKKIFDNPYIAYCGSLTGNKDGVPILINAFRLIAYKYKEIKLVIIGDSNDVRDLVVLKELTRKLNIENRVVFTGRILRDKIPEYLCKATILALARPSSLQSTGGFPSKLGEYLSTGKPVVVTKVGEIPDYLKDGENGFLSDPDSAEAFAEKLDYVLSHPDLATKVGLNGRKVALNNFDYRFQAKRIINFIEKIK